MESLNFVDRGKQPLASEKSTLLSILGNSYLNWFKIYLKQINTLYYNLIEVDDKTKSTKIWSTQIQMIPQLFFLIQIHIYIRTLLLYLMKRMHRDT